MNLIMSYVDYNMASLEKREIFSFSKLRLEEIYSEFLKYEEISGVVIISTCNRTEIYLSLENDENINPFEVLCEILNIDFSELGGIYRTLLNENAIEHLFKVACGVKSQIWGEDQIITQVKDAVSFARENNATDSILEVLFRTAVSGAKKVKTEIDFKTDNNSTAKCAMNIIKDDENIKSVLVIGNGEIGRLCAKLLAQNGIKTTMTLRHYKHSQNIVPSGVLTVDYAERYSKMEQCDAVVSATLSPHFTVKTKEVLALNAVPKLFIDLAVPRDIEPTIADLDAVKYHNIDNLDNEHITYHKLKHMKQIDEILVKYKNDFYKWNEYKNKTVLMK